MSPARKPKRSQLYLACERALERWSPEDRKWLASLPEPERRFVLELAGRLNAAPIPQWLVGEAA